MIRLLSILLLMGTLPLLGQCSHEPDIGQEGPWRHRLYTPTYFTKLADTYFIIDTYHHRILYSNQPLLELSQWNTLTETIGGPHSIATDGEIVVYDDTGHSNLRAARYFNLDNYGLDAEGNADEYEMIFDVGTRPHRVIYDKDMDSFYAIASQSQEILRVTNDHGLLVVKYREVLPFLQKAYTRSMTILDGHMFFVTRGHGIIEATYKDDNFEFVRSYEVPDLLFDLNDLFRSEAGWYYLSAAPAGIVRTRSLESLATRDYEDLYEVLGLKGSPYYLAEFDGTLYLPEVGDNSGVITFKDAPTGPITDIRTHFDFGPPEPPDEWRKSQYPR